MMNTSLDFRQSILDGDQPITCVLFMHGAVLNIKF